jgi:hypothetical protein
METGRIDAAIPKRPDKQPALERVIHGRFDHMPDGRYPDVW